MHLRRLPLPSNRLPDPVCRIFVLEEGDKSPVSDYLTRAATDHANDFAKLLALLDRSTAHGLPANKQKVRQLKGYKGLWEFKAGCLRVFFCRDRDRLVICTHGIVKKAQQTPKKDLKTAFTRMAAYGRAVAENRITLIDP